MNELETLSLTAFGDKTFEPRESRGSGVTVWLSDETLKSLAVEGVVLYCVFGARMLRSEKGAGKAEVKACKCSDTCSEGMGFVAVDGPPVFR